jgi:hypothetical protein
MAEEKSLRRCTLMVSMRQQFSGPISEVRSVLYYDEQARRQLGRERASRLAEEYRRAQRLPRQGSRPAAGQRLVRRAPRPVYRA